MSKLQRFTIKIPTEARRGVYKHLAKHYREDFGKEPPVLITEPKQFNLAKLPVGSIKIKDLPNIQVSPVPKTIKVTEVKDIDATLITDPRELVAAAKDSYERNALGKV